MSTVCTGFYFFLFYFSPILIENSLLIKYGAVWFLSAFCCFGVKFYFLFVLIYISGCTKYFSMVQCLSVFVCTNLFKHTIEKLLIDTLFGFFFYLHLHVSACLCTSTYPYRYTLILTPSPIDVCGLCSFLQWTQSMQILNRRKMNWMRITFSEYFDCVWAFQTFQTHRLRMIQPARYSAVNCNIGFNGLPFQRTLLVNLMILSKSSEIWSIWT